MSKAVLMSIKPKWTKKIFEGKKTIEIRRTRPSIPTPFKVYVYCTKTGMGLYGDRNHYVTDITNFLKGDAAEGFERTSGLHKWNGKVIGEFVCDRIDEYAYATIACAKFEVNGADVAEYKRYNAGACLTAEEMFGYSNGKALYGWHITEPKLFDKPRELGEFLDGRGRPIKRAFQSWGYCNGEKN